MLNNKSKTILLILFICMPALARVQTVPKGVITSTDQEKTATPTIRHDWNAQSAWLKSIAENPICKEVAKKDTNPNNPTSIDNQPYDRRLARTGANWNFLNNSSNAKELKPETIAKSSTIGIGTPNPATTTPINNDNTSTVSKNESFNSKIANTPSPIEPNKAITRQENPSGKTQAIASKSGQSTKDAQDYYDQKKREVDQLGRSDYANNNYATEANKGAVTRTARPTTGIKPV